MVTARKFRVSRMIRGLKDLTLFVTCLSVIVGVVVTVSNMRTSMQQTRLAGWQQARNVFDREDVIKVEVNDFLSKGVPDVQELWNRYRSGRAMYQSKELAQYNRICHHYEEVGALVKQGYIDFGLYYEIVPFPEEFWNTTERLRERIGKNWKGEAKELKDFLSNFEGLKDHYDRKRNGPAWMFWR